MEGFHRRENIDIFKKWAFFQIENDSRLTYQIIDSQTYHIYCYDKVAEFVIWPMGVIEETIYENDELLFYLHFELDQLHLATDFFHRMIDKLVEEPIVEYTKVLLCCTGGMTTGFFAQKMNDYCHLNKIKVELSATASFHLDDVYQNYDMVLVAPQLRYQCIELSQKYKPTIIESIDPITFATYDCPALMNQIDNIKEKLNERKTKDA